MYVSWVQVENPDAIHEPAMHFMRPKFFQRMSISDCLLWASKRMYFCEKFYGPNNYFSLQPKGKCRIELSKLLWCYNYIISLIYVHTSCDVKWTLWCFVTIAHNLYERRFYMICCNTGEAFSFHKGNEFFPLYVCNIHTQAACTAVVSQTERRHLLLYQTEARHSIHMSSVPAFNAVFHRHNFLPAIMPSIVKVFVIAIKNK